MFIKVMALHQYSVKPQMYSLYPFTEKKTIHFKKEKSDLDFEFEDGTSDYEYLSKLIEIVPEFDK